MYTSKNRPRENSPGTPGAEKAGAWRQQLAAMVPLNALTPDNFEAMLREARIARVPAGKPIFKQGESDGHKIYLLAGEAGITSSDGRTRTIRAATDIARHPLAHAQPRQHTAVAKTEVVLMIIDCEQLDILLTWDQSSGYEVEEIEETEDGDWMTRLLQTEAIMRLPAANIQALLMKMEEVPVQAGDVIIREGDEGDYYYILARGHASVTRLSAKAQTEAVLAELSSGSGFGEEALISEAQRNATVTMTTDGSLMRLSKADFLELMEAPLVRTVSLAEAHQMVKDGAVWLDVRLPSEHSSGHIPDSLNVPLYFLRQKAGHMERGLRYICYCDTGRRSTTAAYLLNERGFNAYVLDGGMPDAQASDAA